MNTGGENGENASAAGLLNGASTLVAGILALAGLYLFSPAIYFVADNHGIDIGPIESFLEWFYQPLQWLYDHFVPYDILINWMETW